MFDGAPDPSELPNPTAFSQAPEQSEPPNPTAFSQAPVWNLSMHIVFFRETVPITIRDIRFFLLLAIPRSMATLDEILTPGSKRKTLTG